MGDDYPAVGTTFSLPLPVVLDSLRAVRPLLPSPPTSTSSTDEVRLEPRQVELQTRTHPLGKGVTVKCKLGSRKGGRRRPGEKRLSDDELCSFRLVLQLSESPIDPSIPSYVVTESLPHSHYTHHHHHTLFPRDCLENDVNSITLDPSPSSRIDFENRLLVFRSGYTVPILHSDIPRTTAHYRSSNRRRPAASLDHDENWQFWEDALEVDGAGEAKRKRRKVVMDMGGLGALKEWGWVDGLDEYGEEEEPFEEEIAQNGVVAMETEGADGGTEGHRDAGQPRGEIGDGQDAGDEGEQNGVASASPSPPPSLSPEALQALQPSTKRRRSTTTGSPAWLPGIARSSRRATRRVASAEVFEATDTEGDIYGAVAAEQQEQIDEMDEAMREEEEALDKLASDVAAFLIRPQRMQITSQSVTISNIAAPSPLTPFTPPARNFPPPSPTSPADSSVTASSPADSYFSPCGERDTSLSSVETPTRTFARPRARSVRFADEEEAKHVRAAALSASAGEVVEHKQEEKYELVSDDVDKEREKQALQALLGLSGWRPQPPPPPSDVIQQSASAAPDPQAPPSPAASHALPEGSGATATSRFPAGASPSATSALAFRPRVSSKPAPRRPTPTSALFIPSARKSAPTFSSRASKPFMPPSLQASGASRAVAVAQASAREKEGRQQQQGTSGGGRVGGTTLSAKDETALAEAFRERLWRSGGDFEGGRLDSLYSAATLAKKLELIRTVTPFPTSPILRTPSSAIYLSILSKPHRPSRARLPSLQSLPTFDTPPDILSLFNDKRIRLALEYLYGRSVSTNEMAFLERREKAVWALARTMAAVAEVNERAMRVRRSGVEQDEPRWQARG